MQSGLYDNLFVIYKTKSKRFNSKLLTWVKFPMFSFFFFKKDPKSVITITKLVVYKH